jgi:ABC-type multidrug transport system fused ATPase/permease subunit
MTIPTNRGGLAAKLLRLMTPAERRRAIGLLGLMFVGMILETLGIGLVVPAIALMTRDDLGTRLPAFGRLVAWLGNPNREQLVIGGMLALVTISVVRAVYLSFLAWAQMRFVYDLQTQISQRLFAGYLHQPYTFHIQRNSAHLIRNALGDVDLLTQHGVLQGLNLLAEGLALCGICSLLLYLEPVGALVSIGTLIAAGYAFSHLMRYRIARWASARQHHDGMRMQHLQQGLGAVKEVKLLGREAEFIEQYRIHTRGAARASERNQVLQQLPRLALEMLAVIALAALVIVMIAQHRPLQALLPTIGVFAAAAFRIMPSANRIINAVQGLRYAAPVATTLTEEFAMFNAAPSPVQAVPQRFAHCLKVEDVEFQYPGAAAPALRNISLAIDAGTSVGFIGDSGAGKSTLIDVMLGLMAPQRGRVLVDGVDTRANLAGWQSSIGYVPQQIYLSDDTLRRNIAFGLRDSEIDEAAVLRAVRAAQLEQFVAELPLGLETKVGERGVRLSGGQLQRIGIARALYHDPPVLVLDEATSALDLATERGVMQAVGALHGSKTVLIVTHRLSTVEQCDWLYRLEGGRIIDSGTAGRVVGAAIV